MGCHFLLQGIFLSQGSNWHLLHCRQILYHWATREAQYTRNKTLKPNWRKNCNTQTGKMYRLDPKVHKETFWGWTCPACPGAESLALGFLDWAWLLDVRKWIFNFHLKIPMWPVAFILDNMAILYIIHSVMPQKSSRWYIVWQVPLRGNILESKRQINNPRCPSAIRQIASLTKYNGSPKLKNLIYFN